MANTKNATPKQAMEVPVNTPWGWWRVITAGSQWQLKLLHVRMRHRTSLQTHRHREEWWHVVEGEGAFNVNGHTFISSDGAPWVYVPPGCIHRIAGLAPSGVTIVEMQRQTDDKPIKESDITRLQDDYGRA